MLASAGFVFSEKVVNQFSDSNLETFMTGATFSEMEVEDFSSTEKPIYVSSTAPESPVNGQLWWVPQANGLGSNPVGLLLANVGSSFIPIAEGATYKNVGTIDFVYGDVVTVRPPGPSTPSGEVFEVTAGKRCVGVAGQSIPRGSTGFVITRGFVYIKTITGSPVRWGALLPTSGVGNVSASASTRLVTTGCFGRLIDTTNNLAYICGQWKVT